MSTVRSNDGTIIGYDRIGAGQPIILVDGALGSRTLGTRPALAALLASQFSVFTYDRRGRGESGDTPPYVVEREVEDISALLREAGGSAFVCGVSSGAVLALHAASQLTGITKLALFEPPFVVDEHHPPLPADYLNHLKSLITANRRGEAIAYFMTAAVGVPPDMVDQARATPMWPQMEAVAHTLAYDGAIMGDTMSGSPAPLQRWASVTIPTLVVEGGASPAWMRNGVAAITAILPNARHHTIEGQAHDVSPEALAPVLAEFFNS